MTLEQLTELMGAQDKTSMADLHERAKMPLRDFMASLPYQEERSTWEQAAERFWTSSQAEEHFHEQP